MSIERCLPPLVQSGEITQDQADRVRTLYDELNRDMTTRYGRQAAEAMASEEALRRMGAEAAQRRRQTLLQASAQGSILKRAQLAVGRGLTLAQAMIAHLAHDDRAHYKANEVTSTLIDVIHEQALAKMRDVLHTFSRNVGGRVRQAARLHNVVRELFGEETGDQSAKELAKAWTETAEMLRLRFNAAGGAIGKLERWGLPQSHDSDAVGAVSFEEWRDFIKQRLDPSKMTDASSGLPFTSEGLELALKDVYETIRSNGWAFRKPGSTVGITGKLANRHADSRFLIFKDAEAWLSYFDRFGRPQSSLATAIDPAGPIFDAMMGHVAGMSRDIALMETLGPNPAATVKWMGEVLAKETQTGGSTRFERSKGYWQPARVMEDMYSVMAGTDYAPIVTKAGVAMGAFRNLQTSAKLGSATISAVTDIGFQTATRLFSGLPVTRALTGYLRQFNPASSVDREIARRVGFGAMDVARTAIAQARYSTEVVSGELSARLANVVIRASGLSAWTTAGKRAFGVDFLNHLTTVSTTRWDNLNGRYRGMLERYGFTEASWDELRSTPLEEMGGSHWLLPDNIENPRLAEQLMGAIASETRYAVPDQPNLQTRALLNKFSPQSAYLAPGTFWGQIIRSPLQFKMFGISAIMMHGRRAVDAQGLLTKLGYGAALGISTTLLGALAWQMKNIDRGEDPEPMGPDNLAFWAQSAAQGGAFGMAGDFIQSGTSRTGGGADEYIAGPMWGDIKNLGKLVADTGSYAMGSDTANPGRDLARMVQSDVPGSSLWYVKLAYQRALADQLKMQIDPQYSESFAKMENRAAQMGTGYFWEPGETLPSRAPNLSNAGEEAPVHP
jgi:hypothetical protein